MGTKARSAISVDIGGTFTDLVLMDGAGRCFPRKVPSTPAAPLLRNE